MTYILNIETSTKVCSVTVSKNGEDFLVRELESDAYSHSEKLNVFIQEMISESSISLKDIDAIAVSGGPGSYTGLRIGSSSAKGLCYALDIPLIAIHTLKGMFAYIRRNQTNFERYIPMIDARRMEVYASIFDQDGNELKEVSADILELGIYDSFIDGKKTLIFGNGAKKSMEFFSGEAIHFDSNSSVSALGMNQLSYEKYKEKRFENLAYFEPNYLKDFIAGKPKKIL